MECLIVTVRKNDAALIAEFESFFQTRVTEMVALSRPVLDRAVQIRASTKLKTPAAIQIACAMEANCDTYVTNDHQLAQCTGIRVELL